jgi:hypothetical protein
MSLLKFRPAAIPADAGHQPVAIPNFQDQLIEQYLRAFEGAEVIFESRRLSSLVGLHSG